MTTTILPTRTSIDAKVTSLTPLTIGGIRIEKVSERTPYFNLMVYGKSGVGKTYLAGSSVKVPEMRRVLYIDIEGGILTLRKDFPDVETVRVTNWKQMKFLYEELRAGGHGFKTVICDSLTEIQKFNMDDIMKALVDKNDERDMDVPSLREWGKNLEQTRRFVRSYRDLPMNVIFTALERDDKDRLQRPIKLPSLSGKMAGEVAAFLDIVLYYNIKEVTADGETQQLRVLQSAATETVIAKDRSGLLPKALVDPDMEQLYDIIVRKTGAFATAEVIKSETVETKPEIESVKIQPPTDEEIANLTKN